MHDLTVDCPEELTLSQATGREQSPEVVHLSSFNEQVRGDGESSGNLRFLESEGKKAAGFAFAQTLHSLAAEPVNLKTTCVISSLLRGRALIRRRRAFFGKDS